MGGRTGTQGTSQSVSVEMQCVAWQLMPISWNTTVLGHEIERGIVVDDATHFLE